MKTKILSFLAALFVVLGASTHAVAQDNSTYFPYPAVPDSMTTLQSRCDYLVHHFWDFCDLKKGFSSKQKMAQAFADYISFMPHASKDSVLTSLNVFFKKLDKQPDDLLFIVDCAESQLMGDSAQFISEELYLPFAKAVVANKKIDKTTKARYEHQLKILGGTQPGMTIPELDYIDRFGNPAKLSADTAEIVLLYFNDPTCEDCQRAKVRLDANIKAGVMIRRGMLKVVSITVDDFSPEWQELVKDFPIEWRVGATPDADTVYDIARYPSFYFIDENQKIVAKNLTIDQVLQVIDRL